MLVGLLAGCSPAPGGTPSPSSARTACARQDDAPRPAQPVDDGTPPPAPQRVELRPLRPGDARVSVRVVAAPGVQYESVELRVLVNGCRVPWTDEGDQLPTQTIGGTGPGDRLLVLARLNGAGGNSAETAGALLVPPRAEESASASR